MTSSALVDSSPIHHQCSKRHLTSLVGNKCLREILTSLNPLCRVALYIYNDILDDVNMDARARFNSLKLRIRAPVVSPKLATVELPTADTYDGS